MERETLFADIILPLAIPKTYTYRIPVNMNEQAGKGKRAVVQFGRSKLYTGLIFNVHTQAPKQYTAKYLDSILDDEPIVSEIQFAFWRWVSTYYMCNLGEVMLAALPTGFRLVSETKLLQNKSFDKIDFLTDKELLVFEALDMQPMLTIKDVSEILDQKTVYPIIKSLIEKKAIVAEEEIKEKYKPRVIPYVKLTKEYENEEKVKEALNSLSNAKKQLHVLMQFLQLSKWGSKDYEPVKKIPLQKKANATANAVNALLEKGFIEIVETEEGRLPEGTKAVEEKKELSKAQQDALTSINEKFQKQDIVLLHGVTSSGKTEVYIELIKQVIAEGKQVLYLLPEIALTTQIIVRLQKHFGNKIGVYHSHFNQNERVEVWNSVLYEKPYDYQIILGARSAVFLPFTNLGLVIADEEHESSFKQFDPAPRYNGRDAAIVLAQIHKAKTVLGSATPALETYWNAVQGKYGLVELTERFGKIEMPLISVVDVKEAQRKKQMKSHFHPTLMEEMESVLSKNGQIILFQNRRGFSPFVQCHTCAWIPQCTRCDISLTYHKHTNNLRCHYCGYSENMPQTCNACGDTNVQTKGFGTEKIEEELSIFLPKAKIKRMDLDTTRSKHAYQRIINDFQDGEIDILVGTQMVTKGLDFDNVALVGILNADQMLGFPDFRAFERSYQLMAQVSGRAGRKKSEVFGRGKVIIQAFTPEHRVIQQVVNNDYHKLYHHEILERKDFKYPPYYRFIRITLRHKEFDLVNAASFDLANGLKEIFGGRILGPEFPPVARVRNQYNKNILLKIERQADLGNAKKVLKQQLVNFKSRKNYKPVRIIINVDPQ